MDQDNQSKLTTTRRGFFTHVAQFVGLALVAPLLGSKALAEERRRPRPEAGGAAAGGGDANLPEVEPGKGAASAVNYVTKHADVKDKALKIERQGVAFEKQQCSGCGFYTKAGMAKGKEVGKCQIFPNQVVHADAWCSSWNKKA